MSKKIEEIYLETRIHLHEIRDRIGEKEYMSIIMTEASYMLSYLDDEFVDESIHRLKKSIERFREARKSESSLP